MRFLAVGMAVLLWLVSVETSSAASLMVVAVPQGDTNGKQILDIHRPFHVLLCNLKARDLKLWSETCSWGYYNLAFEFKGADGKMVKVIRNPVADWTWNQLGAYAIPPGGTHNLTVDFFAWRSRGVRDWLGAEALRGPMTMRVIYVSPGVDGPFSQDRKDVHFWKLLHGDSVWTGSVKSDPIEVVIKR